MGKHQQMKMTLLCVCDGDFNTKSGEKQKNKSMWTENIAQADTLLINRLYDAIEMQNAANLCS